MAGVLAYFNSPNSSLLVVNTGSTDQVLGYITAPTGQGVRGYSLEITFFGLAAGDSPTVKLVPLSSVAGAAGTANNPVKGNTATDPTNLVVRSTGFIQPWTTQPTIASQGFEFNATNGANTRTFSGDLLLIVGGQSYGIVVNMNGSTTGSVKCVFSWLNEE